MCKFKVHKINAKRKYKKYERGSRVLISPLSTHQWLTISNLIQEIHSMHVITKQENTLLKNENNSYLVGTNHPPSH